MENIERSRRQPGEGHSRKISGRRRSVAFFIAAGSLALLGACSEGKDAADGATTTRGGPAIEIKNFDFQPDPLTVSVGDSVTWTNQDDILHTVTSGIGQEQGVPGVSKNKDAKPDGLYTQDMDGVGAEFSFTFDKPGSYDYYCAIHPGMTGTIEVK
jgi:plastocyanin